MIQIDLDFQFSIEAINKDKEAITQDIKRLIRKRIALLMSACIEDGHIDSYGINIKEYKMENLDV